MTGFIPLTSDEKDELLQTARRSIELAVSRRPLPEIVLTDYSSTLQALGASFVTLTQAGELRGCIGAIEAYQPLVQDVCEHAVCAALSDYRFYPVRPEDVPQLKSKFLAYLRCRQCLITNRMNSSCRYSPVWMALFSWMASIGQLSCRRCGRKLIQPRNF
jgi:hypothetical protein